jgi:hypothetical protein
VEQLKKEAGITSGKKPGAKVKARLMCGLGLEPSTDIPADSPYSTLCF